jgi:hypothetical protein
MWKKVASDDHILGSNDTLVGRIIFAVSRLWWSYLEISFRNVNENVMKGGRKLLNED